MGYDDNVLDLGMSHFWKNSPEDWRLIGIPGFGEGFPGLTQSASSISSCSPQHLPPRKKIVFQQVPPCVHHFPTISDHFSPFPYHFHLRITFFPLFSHHFSIPPPTSHHARTPRPPVRSSQPSSAARWRTWCTGWPMRKAKVFKCRVTVQALKPWGVHWEMILIFHGLHWVPSSF